MLIWDVQIVLTQRTSKELYSDFSNKSNENIRNDVTGTESNQDLIEALKSKLLDEFMPYIKIFITEELKFSKQKNDLVNSNTEIIKSLER